MKNLWNILSVLLLLHIIFLAAGGLWLRQSDRLDKNRVKQVIALFTPTLAEDRLKAEELIKAEEEAARQKEEAVRLASVSKGPLTAEDRVVTDDQEEELLRQRLQRLDRERQDLLRQIEMAKSALSQQKIQLDEQRSAFDKQVADEIQKRKDEDFQLALQMYEQVRPKQGKQMMQELIVKGQMDQVVEYMAAMQLRKAAAILKEFKTPPEVAMATELVQHLRKRGVAPLTSMSGTVPAGASGNQPMDATRPMSQTPGDATKPPADGDAS